MDRDGAVDGVAAWFSDVRVDETLAALPDGVVIAVAVAAVGVALHPVTWRVFGYPVTIVHELGHVIAALTAGFRLRGMTVNGDMSGATNFWSHSTPGTLWAMWWGYPAPALAGWALIWSASHGWSRLALLVLAACLAFVFLLSRSWHTVGVVVATGLAAGLIGWYGSALACTVVVFAFAWLLIVGSVRGLWAVLRTHITRRGVQMSDAYLMSRTWILPSAFWLLSFALAIATGLWLSADAVLGAVASTGS